MVPANAIAAICCGGFVPAAMGVDVVIVIERSPVARCRRHKTRRRGSIVLIAIADYDSVSQFCSKDYANQ
jgi:hypothetical protein